MCLLSLMASRSQSELNVFHKDTVDSIYIHVNPGEKFHPVTYYSLLHPSAGRRRRLFSDWWPSFSFVFATQRWLDGSAIHLTCHRQTGESFCVRRSLLLLMNRALCASSLSHCLVRTPQVGLSIVPVVKPTQYKYKP